MKNIKYFYLKIYLFLIFMIDEYTILSVLIGFIFIVLIIICIIYNKSEHKENRIIVI